MGQYDNWPPFREPLMEPLADYMARKQRRRAYVAALERVAQAAREVLSNCYPHAAVDRDWDVLSHAAQHPLEHALAALDALTEGTDG